jgi:hypothetical protein
MCRKLKRLTGHIRDVLDTQAPETGLRRTTVGRDSLITIRPVFLRDRRSSIYRHLVLPCPSPVDLNIRWDLSRIRITTCGCIHVSKKSNGLRTDTGRFQLRRSQKIGMCWSQEPHHNQIRVSQDHPQAQQSLTHHRRILSCCPR